MLYRTFGLSTAIELIVQRISESAVVSRKVSSGLYWNTIGNRCSSGPSRAVRRAASVRSRRRTQTLKSVSPAMPMVRSLAP